MGAPPVDRARVAAVLNSVVDPCSAAAGAPAGLLEMGLVKDVEVAVEGGRAHVEVVLRLTHPSCLMGPLFVESAEQGLLALPGVESAKVSLAADYSWTEEAMSEEYRARLAALRGGGAT